MANLQNFTDKISHVTAQWLNQVDVLLTSIFGQATNNSQARTALFSDNPLEQLNGGTGARSFAPSQQLATDAVGKIVTVPFPPPFVLTYATTAAEIAAGVTIINPQFEPGVIDRYFNNLIPGTTDATAGFNAAIAQNIQPNGSYVSVNNAYYLAASVTIPEGATLQVDDTGSITGTLGAIFTIQGQIIAPRVPVFPGPWPNSMVVAFSQKGCCAEAYPEWFGAIGDSLPATPGTDCTASLTAAITACSGGSLTLGVGAGIVPLRLASGYYLTGNQILTPAFTLRGTGRKTSGFVALDGTAGYWFTDNGNSAGIILEDFAWYGRSAACPNMQRLGRFGYGPIDHPLVQGYAPHGSEGYFRGLWPRDCACQGSGWALDINANIGFYDLISVYVDQPNPPSGNNLMRVIGVGNMLSKIALLGAGPNSYSLYLASEATIVHGLEIEAPGSCNASFAPLSIQRNAYVYGCVISLNNAAASTFDHLIETTVSAFSWALEGLMLFNATGQGTVTGGNIKLLLSNTYIGGALQPSQGNQQGTGSYVSGMANVLSGTATFGGGNTIGVALPAGQTVSNYKVMLGGNPAGNCWVTQASKTPNGFTITCSSSNSNAIDWSVTL